jgi:hypothetical protein
MHATRLHMGTAFEWIVAAAFLLATFSVGLLIVRELGSMGSPSPRIIEESAPAPPAAVPAETISVPVLLLLDGKQIRLGDSLDKITGLLGREAEVGTQAVGHGPLGERLIRYYEHAGTRFILVFEPFERDGAPRVTGIHIQ